MGMDEVLRSFVRSENAALADGVEDEDMAPVLFTCSKDWEILEALATAGRVEVVDTLTKWIAAGLPSGLADFILRDLGFAGNATRTWRPDGSH